VRGPADAWVTVVEFSDFECPYCGAVQETLASVLPAYGNDVRHVFKHYPLSFHPFARRTAIAAECAHAQGLFWPFEGLVFGGQSSLFAGP
jgi:protein-disulfide isomerase